MYDGRLSFQSSGLLGRVTDVAGRNWLSKLMLAMSSALAAPASRQIAGSARNEPRRSRRHSVPRAIPHTPRARAYGRPSFGDTLQHSVAPVDAGRPGRPARHTIVGAALDGGISGCLGRPATGMRDSLSIESRAREEILDADGRASVP